MAGFCGAPLVFLTAGETPGRNSSVHDPGEIVHDKKDDFLMFMIHEKHEKLVEMLKFGLIPSSREQFHECQIHLFANTSIQTTFLARTSIFCDYLQLYTYK